MPSKIFFIISVLTEKLDSMCYGPEFIYNGIHVIFGNVQRKREAGGGRPSMGKCREQCYLLPSVYVSVWTPYSSGLRISTHFIPNKALVSRPNVI